MELDRRIALVERMTAAFADEIDRHDPSASIAWPWWPDVRSLVGHLGGIHGWAAEVVRTGEEVPDPEDRPAPGQAREWYLERRAALLDALRSAPGDRPCWVFTGDDRTVGFWRTRMVFETTKHLIDLRAAGGGVPAAPGELDAEDFADGIDELLSVFLDRSRPGLAPLPAPVLLQATDGPRSWLVTPDWTISHERDERDERDEHDGQDGSTTIVRATTGDLALLVWDRADPLADGRRFAVSGSHQAVAAFRDAAVHP